MKYLTLIGLSSLLFGSQAQWFRLGVSGEYNIGRVFFNPDRANQTRALYGGGFLLQYTHIEWDIMIESGLNYKRKGWIAPEQSLFDLSPGTPVNLEYIEIPLRAYIFLTRSQYNEKTKQRDRSKPFDIFINIGNFIGFAFNQDSKIDSLTQPLSYGWEGYLGVVLRTKFGNLQLKAGGIFHFSNFLKKEYKHLSSLSRYSASSFQIVYFSPILFNFNNHKRRKLAVAKNRPRFTPERSDYSEKEKKYIRERKKTKTVSSLVTYEQPKKEKKTVGFGSFGAGRSKPKGRKSSGFGSFGAGKKSSKPKKTKHQKRTQKKKAKHKST